MADHPSKIVVDLDGVIAGAKPENGDYSNCLPNGRVVERLKQLREAGFLIAVHTSRNVKTHEHNAGALTAKTVPLLTAWLMKHSVPYDEIWVGKPWAGPGGVYVDDRAVRPSELINLTLKELTARATGEHYDPRSPGWRVLNPQRWTLIDARDDHELIVSNKLLTTVREKRALDVRSVVLISPRQQLQPGFDEQLQRLGVLVRRVDARQAIEDIEPTIKRELALDGAGSLYISEKISINLALSDEYREQLRQNSETLLDSRHFNRVVIKGDRVIKTSEDGPTRDKLTFELEWLQAIGTGSVEGVVPDLLAAVPSGYRMRHHAGGSLARVLLRDTLDDLELAGLAEALSLLWNDLGHVKARSLDAAPLFATPEETLAEFQSLIWHKSRAREGDLHKLLESWNLGGTYSDWIVNGENCGNIMSMITRLIAMIPAPKREHRGTWHGDFCPGNIVLTSSVHDDAPIDLRLIDPRGTLDGERLALYGDRRYDLGKLAHALLYGYDVILEEWYDCHWTGPHEHQLEVDLRLWDEDSGLSTNRSRLWRSLQSHALAAGDTFIASTEVKAIAALQLITCAPLHSEDPKRVIALIARGMQAANALR